jgi:tetratricopeptide (TPR) repeat protein
LESASVTYGKATPYFPVIDLLKNYVKIDVRDETQTIRAKVTGQVLTLDEGFHDTIPALLMLLEALREDSAFLGLDPLQRRQRTLEALNRVLLRESQVQPLLLESVRTLVETGILAGQSGGYRLAKPLASIRVPATVQAVLTARIDRLLSEEKRLLQTAAVIGTEVPFPLLQAVAKLPEEALRRGLAHLQAAELLYETSLFPELAYTFKHALTHEVAYGSLLQERRRGLHALIVEALETLYPDRLAEQVERLAHHAFRGEMWDKALTYFREAGVKAGTRFAYPEAVACFEQALEALTHLPESRHTLEQGIDRRVVLRTALLPLGEFRRIHDLLRDAATLAEALHDQRRLGLISDRLCLASWQMGDYGAALQFGQRALAISKALGDVNPAIDGECRFSTHLHRTG